MNILFVCTGNSCRSPMAEAVLRKQLQDCGQSDMTISSAGISAAPGMPAAPPAASAVAREGADLSAHQSRPLDSGLIAWADRIIAMTRSHRQAICARFPDAADKVSLLMVHAGRNEDVPDPIGGSTEDYIQSLNQMKPALTALCQSLCNPENGAS